MRHSGTLTNRLTLSVLAIIAAFFGFWGISALAGLVAGVRPADVFQHKVPLLLALAVSQLVVVLSHPMRNKLHLALRLAGVSMAIICTTWLFSKELIAIRLVNPSGSVAIIFLALGFVLLICILLYRKLVGRTSV